MVPAWMFIGVTVLLCLALAGWGLTIRKSMARALHMYEFGRVTGDDEGWKRAHDQVVKAVAKAKRRKR